jgi:GNAT superfamily N-acetyltransferase
VNAGALVGIAPEEYVREVLPQSFGLWGGGRTFDRYVADFRTAVTSPYARRSKHVWGLYDGDSLAASCKLYSRDLRWGDRTLRAAGIGGVFTDPLARGRGFATALMGAILDRELAAGTDVAYLFSNIDPLFYGRIGFVSVPSRRIAVRATTLNGSRSGAVPIEERDWPGIARAFETLDAGRPWSLVRTPAVWAWVRRRWTATHEGGQPVRLAARRGRSVRAYVVGRRVVERDAFFVEEYGYDGDEHAELASAVLRAAAGDLRRVVGWLPPEPARGMLPRGAVRPRSASLLMVAPLSRAGRAWWKAVGGDVAASAGDPVWPADHL